MKVPLTFLFYFSLPLFVRSVDFRNNACPKLLHYHISAFSSKCYVNPDVMSNVPSMVKRNGYNISNHSLTTDDGYILTLFEIWKTVTKNVTIFIQHGIVASSVPWVDIGNRSIAFHLAQRGYKVWLGNTRGTTYSNKHKNVSIHNSNYWKFNMDTIIENDMITQLNFVAEISGQKIHYIGHSMGTTLGLMFASTFTEKTTQWLQSVALLAPVVYLHNNPTMALLKTPAFMLFNILSSLGVRGLFYRETYIHKLLVFVCKLLPEVCYGVITFVAGATKNFQSEDLLLFVSCWPAGGSVDQFKHFLQITKSKKFQKFDYGGAENLKKYGTQEPPVYNLTNVTIPVGLFYGENDNLYSKKCIDQLYDEIGSSEKYKYSISSEGNHHYNHLDFLYGKSMVQDFYPILENFLQAHENS